MIITLIVASARNGVIGADNAIPWHLPDDLRFFKRTTLGHPIIMGRKTYASIGRPLPKRQNIVVTRNKAFSAPGIDVVHGLSEAFALARETGTTECFVIGGGELYRHSLPIADRLHWTRVEAEVEGDVRFPEPGPDWAMMAAEPHAQDADHAHAFRFERWERRYP